MRKGAVQLTIAVPLGCLVFAVAAAGCASHGNGPRRPDGGATIDAFVAPPDGFEADAPASTSDVATPGRPDSADDTPVDASAPDATDVAAPSPQIIFSRGCMAGGGGLFMIRADGTGERMLFPPGHMLSPVLVYPPDRLILDVDGDVEMVSLTTGAATLLAARARFSTDSPIAAGKGVYSPADGSVHVVDLDSLDEVDLGVGEVCGSTSGGDVVYLSGDVQAHRILKVYRLAQGASVDIDVDSAVACGGVLSDDRITYTGKRDPEDGDALFMTDPNGLNPRFISPRWNGDTPDWLPDGRILVERYADVSGSHRDYFAIDLETAAEQTLIAGPPDPRLVGLSADGRVVFERLVPTDAYTLGLEIWSIRYDGSDPLRLYDSLASGGTFYDTEVKGMSPAGRVVFGRTRSDHDWDLYSVSASGGEPVLLGTCSPFFANPTFLPGERLAFTREDTLFSIGLDGSKGWSLAGSPGTKFMKTFLPDGRILFETLGSGLSDLSLVNSDGSHEVTLGWTPDCEGFELLVP